MRRARCRGGGWHERLAEILHRCRLVGARGHIGEQPPQLPRPNQSNRDGDVRRWMLRCGDIGEKPGMTETAEWFASAHAKPGDEILYSPHFKTHEEAERYWLLSGPINPCRPLSHNFRLTFGTVAKYKAVNCSTCARTSTVAGRFSFQRREHRRWDSLSPLATALPRALPNWPESSIIRPRQMSKPCGRN